MKSNQCKKCEKSFEDQSDLNKHAVSIHQEIRGGVKLEFVRNSFDSIRKFTIRLIGKGKNIRKI